MLASIIFAVRSRPDIFVRAVHGKTRGAKGTLQQRLVPLGRSVLSHLSDSVDCPGAFATARQTDNAAPAKRGALLNFNAEISNRERSEIRYFGACFGSRPFNLSMSLFSLSMSLIFIFRPPGITMSPGF